MQKALPWIYLISGQYICFLKPQQRYRPLADTAVGVCTAFGGHCLVLHCIGDAVGVLCCFWSRAWSSAPALWLAFARAHRCRSTYCGLFARRWLLWARPAALLRKPQSGRASICRCARQIGLLRKRVRAERVVPVLPNVPHTRPDGAPPAARNVGRAAPSSRWGKSGEPFR